MLFPSFSPPPENPPSRPHLNINRLYEVVEGVVALLGCTSTDVEASVESTSFGMLVAVSLISTVTADFAWKMLTATRAESPGRTVFGAMIKYELKRVLLSRLAGSDRFTSLLRRQ